MEFKVGDIFNIHSYKHDHKIHRSWDQAIYIDQTKDYAIFGNYKTLVTESDGRTWRTREPAIMYFSKDNWFNIIGQIKSTGIYYYCNIASPYIIDGNIIKYIDYDLDLRVFPDGGYKVLDRNEYKFHKKIMHYPDEIDHIVNKELENLIEMKKNNEGPFNKSLIEEYYEKYKQIAAK